MAEKTLQKSQRGRLACQRVCVCEGVNYIIKVIKGERWREVGPRPNPVKAFDPSLVS